MILNEFGSAVFGSSISFDDWCILNGFKDLKRRVYQTSEKGNEYKVYNELIAKGYKVYKSTHSIGSEEDEHHYVYLIPHTQEEKETYWKHRVNFQYLYIASWMESIEAAERWFHETYDNPVAAKLEEAEFAKAHKPTLPNCILKGKQCSLFCPHYNAKGCQMTAKEEQKIKNYLEYYKVKKEI